MEALPAKSWRNVFLAALALFVVSRALLLTAFPIFNDEAIYLQYAQQIHQSWERNKFISMDNQYHDWKPPLQYWLAAPVIDWGNDPLIAGRAVAVTISLAGFFGFYLFGRELFGVREGAIVALLYALCPPVIFHNTEFIAETFVFSMTPLVYWSLLKTFRPNEWRWLWLVPAILVATALLLFKQSGSLMLTAALFLPLVRFRKINLELLINFACVVAIIVGANFLSGIFLPAEFDSVRDQFNGRWVMSAREIAAVPLDVWRANLHLVANYIAAYYSWLALVFVVVFFWLAFRRRNFAEIALALMFAASAGAICFLLRGFNEYLFNTAIIALLLPILARTGILVCETLARWPRRALLALAGITLAFWAYQIGLMRISPGRYLERSTRWAKENYLAGWPSGFGMKETVAFLEKEKRPGVILADAQWGNPRTALEVYQHDHFPNLQIVPVLRVFPESDEISKWIARARETSAVRFAIFSADPSGNRKLWQTEIERVCSERTEIKADPAQTPIVVCRF